MAASHYKLGNLVAIVDANGFSGAGPTSQAINIEPIGIEVDDGRCVALLPVPDEVGEQAAGP